MRAGKLNEWVLGLVAAGVLGFGAVVAGGVAAAVVENTQLDNVVVEQVMTTCQSLSDVDLQAGIEWS